MDNKEMIEKLRELNSLILRMVKPLTTWKMDAQRRLSKKLTK